MINDPAMSAASRRILAIEQQLQSLRADIAATDAERTARLKISEPRRQLRDPKPTPRTDLYPQDALQPRLSIEPSIEGATRPSECPPAQRAAVASGNAKPREQQSQQHAYKASPHTPMTLERLLSGRGLAVCGVLLMLIGCAFFIDLSFTRGWIGPGERIALGLVIGAMLLAGSTRFLRGTYRIAAEAATGLGAGMMFLSSWAAVTVFPDLEFPMGGAFGITAIVACALTLIANRWRSQPIALMGLAGAYLTPLLFSDTLNNRAALAAYLLLVTSGLLILARRRSFAGVEITAVVASALYSIVFVPTAWQNWTNFDAAFVATGFFVMFAFAYTMRPIRSTSSFALVPFITTTSVYVLILEGLFNDKQMLLGAVLAGLAVVLLAAPNVFKALPRELKPAYRFIGLLVGNLALRSLLHRTELFDVVAMQAAALTIFGSRIGNNRIANIGQGMFAISAAGLLFEAASLAPAHTLLTTLTLGFVVWIQSAFSARHAVPKSARLAFLLVAHGVALAGLTRAALELTGGSAWNVALPSVAQVTLSLVWALFGAFLFGRGLLKRAAVERWEGLALFAVTIVKVFTVDLASLDITYRVLAFLGTGVVLFVCSACYMRSMRSLDIAAG